MKNYIEINVGYSERRNTLYRAKAHIIAKAPEVGDVFDDWEIVSVRSAWLDPQQPRDEVYDYDYYLCEVKDPHDDDFEHEEHYYAVAVECEDEEP